MSKILLILEVSRKQDYIFSSIHLRDNAARSDIIRYVTSEEFFKQAAPEYYNILGVEPDFVRMQAADTKYRYKAIERKISEELADEVRTFINDNKIKGVYLETDAKRYYPYSSLGAQHFLCDLIRVDKDGFHGGGRRQDVHVAVIDLTARGRESGRARLVVDRKRLIMVVLDDHQLIQRRDQRNKCNNAAQYHQKQCAAQDHPVRPLVLLRTGGSFLILFMSALRAKNFECHLPCLSRSLCQNKGGFPSANRPCQVLFPRLCVLGTAYAAVGRRYAMRFEMLSCTACTISPTMLVFSSS